MLARPGSLELLFLNHNLRNDGTFFRAFPMAEALVAAGHRVTLLSVSRQRTLRTVWSQVQGVRLGETPNLRPEFGAAGYGVLDLLARTATACAHRYDLIHMFDHKPNATWPAFLARAWRGTPIICDWADWWGGSPGSINDVPHRFPLVHQFEDWWEVQSKLRCDGVTTISRTLQERALAVGCDPTRLIYIPTGAPLQRIVPVDKLQARARLGLAGRGPLLGFVGISQEDLEIVFTTLQRLPEARLLLIGPVIEKVQQLAESMRVLSQVISPGRVHGPALNDYLGSCDVLCLPMKDNAYNRGRLPNKLLDYLAAGRAVVSCPVGDVARILGADDRAGVLVSASDFPNAVASLLDDGPRLLELGERARRLAEDQFDWMPLTKTLEEFYFNVIAGGQSG